MLNKIKGALFGLAIGDALGGTTEFLTKVEISQKYGVVREIIGGGCWRLEKGETTDDTAMTVAVAKGILKNSEDPIEAIGEEFLKWYETRPKDVGMIISTVLGTFNGSWFNSAEKAHYQLLQERSAGNGSLMRCLPVALFYQNLKKVETVTRDQSNMTHFDPMAAEACVIYNRIAFHVLHGKALKKTIQDEIKGTIYESSISGEKPACPPDGFVVNTMKWVLYWLLTSESFSEVVIGATNEGHDTDTVAAIAGGLAGLSCGYEAIPNNFKNKLLLKQELEQLAYELLQGRN
ncbi:ADP-ribosylglycohydrolase family protein [Niallia oryzisoli]|uniref:ADP-ribosylglycohydrolase family protein n=1 Tax=Niallia oryzisoli TaxID=1737571 RepID=A0ABZ2CSY1_9BACI